MAYGITTTILEEIEAEIERDAHNPEVSLASFLSLLDFRNDVAKRNSKVLEQIKNIENGNERNDFDKVE
jgi:hypothetical protein